MTRLRDLCAGDLISSAGDYWTFVGAGKHPTLPAPWYLAIWYNCGEFVTSAAQLEDEVGYSSGFRDDNQRRLAAAFDGL